VTEQPSEQVASAVLAVVDTVIVSAILVGTQRAREAELLSRYDIHLRGTSIVLSFATVSELRYGSLKGGWGDARKQGMEDWFSEVATVVMPDNGLVNVCANLRDQCRRRGHALSDKIHDSDRWIAATAIRHGLPLISDDGIFREVPGLALLQEQVPAKHEIDASTNV
jgi:tRNA(fMet)-specific endonuclease VapC